MIHSFRIPGWLFYRRLLGLGLLAGLLTLALATGTSAQAAQPQTLAGTTWAGTTTFLAGSRQGQSQPITLTFQSNGCLTVQTDGSTGYGYWFRTPSGQFIYTFREMLPALDGDVQVVHLISFTGSTRFVSNGEGYLYDQDRQPDETIHNVTRTQVVFKS